jgi:hypothetical protein
MHGIESDGGQVRSTGLFRSPPLTVIHENRSNNSLCHTVQVPDMTTAQWMIFLDWIEKTLRGKPGLNVTMEQALELVPFAHKVHHYNQGECESGRECFSSNLV